MLNEFLFELFNKVISNQIQIFTNFMSFSFDYLTIFNSYPCLDKFRLYSLCLSILHFPSLSPSSKEV
jgi:hypothetical protein